VRINCSIPILIALTTPPAAAGLRVIASAPGTDINVPSGGAAGMISFAGVPGAVADFGVSGRFTAPVADQNDGLYPWSSDFRLTVTAPGGASATCPAPWFGDRSFADYPVDDAFGGLGGVAGDGVWTLSFNAGVVPPFVAGLRGVTYHLLAETPDIEFSYADTTAQGNSWNRPFFIAGVSGLGPMDYHALAFRVAVSGLYHFESVLASAGDHFTCLYRDAFDDSTPLVNLREYGLGNGFSPFDVPRGTSRFSQLLFEGTTYIWVTSAWSAISPPSAFANRITGPGVVSPVGAGCNAADLAEPFGVLDLADLQGFAGAFVAGDPSADLAPPTGVLDLADVQAFVSAFLAGCP
jgi:hypothetical protein